MHTTVVTSTRDSEQERANRIMDYWGRRGYEVNARVVPLRQTTGVFNAEDDEDAEEDVMYVRGYQLRTDMICGWPRKLFEERCRALLA